MSVAPGAKGDEAKPEERAQTPVDETEDTGEDDANARKMILEQVGDLAGDQLRKFAKAMAVAMRQDANEDIELEDEPGDVDTDASTDAENDQAADARRRADEERTEEERDEERFNRVMKTIAVALRQQTKGMKSVDKEIGRASYRERV